ncbi:MAG: hypothetical protein IIA45_12045 [Bacteroidetes bacterium]|nr:hypothetical protein [Bacteroidota bacterium]
MKNKSFILLLTLFVLMFSSCGDEQANEHRDQPQESSDKEITPNEPESSETGAEFNVYEPGEEIQDFKGRYFIATKGEKTDEIKLLENCWTERIDKFSLNAFGSSEDGYYIAFDGHYLDMYQLTESELHGDTLVFRGVLEEQDPDIDMDEGFKMYKVSENVWNLQTEGSSAIYTLVRESDEEEFPFIACEDQLTEEKIQDEIVRLMFMLSEGDEDVSKYIPEKGIFMMSPGPGVAPIESTLENIDDLYGTNLFGTAVYERLLEYIQMHQNEERSFISMDDVLPDMCEPDQEGLFLICSNLERDGGPATARAMLVKRNDEADQMYTYFILTFEYDERLIITAIDTRDCSA